MCKFQCLSCTNLSSRPGNTLDMHVHHVYLAAIPKGYLVGGEGVATSGPDHIDKNQA